MILLFVVNLLVILVPNIRDIFGITGGMLHLEALTLPEKKDIYKETFPTQIRLFSPIKSILCSFLNIVHYHFA